MKEFNFKIATPEKLFADTAADMVKFTLPDGEYVVLADHEPVTAALQTGMLSFRSQDEVHDIICSDGFVEVRPDGVIVFARECVWADGLDEEAEKLEKEKMRDRLRFEQSLVTHHSASIFLTRAMEPKRKKHSYYK